MYNRALLSSFTLLILLAGSLLFVHLRRDAADLLSYKNLKQEAEKNRSVLEEEKGLCQREGLQKDLFFIEPNEERHQIQIQSERSILKLKEERGKISAVEEMEKMFCIVQEEIQTEDNLQKVRTFFAEKGTYFFPSHQFQAEEADVFFYTISGKKFPTRRELFAPYMRAHALQVSFDQKNKRHSFSAAHLQLQFDPEETIP